MVTYLCRHLTYDMRGARHTIYAMLLYSLNEMLPEIHRMEILIFSNLYFILK